MNDGIYGYSLGPVIYNVPVMPKRPCLTMKLSMKFCIRFSAGSLYTLGAIYRDSETSLIAVENWYGRCGRRASRGVRTFGVL
jgi:hypothetical protein